MFTGLVEGIGTIETVGRVGGDVRLTVAPCFEASQCRPGDSVAVDGVCLTVTDIEGATLRMDVSGETIARSTLGMLRHGDRVNLERALRLSDRLGGHIVLGHVDGIGTVRVKRMQQRSWVVGIAVEERLSRYIIEKGSIAVDGVSLTVNGCTGQGFDVNIIPHTGRDTTLLAKRIGDSVNIETDLIGKYVEKLCTRHGAASSASGISLETLLRKSFGE